MKTPTILGAAAALALTACGSDDYPASMNADAADNAAQIEAQPGNAAGSAVRATEAATPISVAQKEPFGDYLVDGTGRSLYMLETEGTAASGGQQQIKCTDACLGEWPAVTVSGQPQAGPQLDSSKLSTIQRPDGSTQIAYAGHPLYYYVGDNQPGSTSGQHLHDRWGEWYLLSPQGQPIEADR